MGRLVPLGLAGGSREGWRRGEGSGEPGRNNAGAQPGAGVGN